MKKQVLFVILMLLPLVASAIEVANADGVTIYYNYTNNGTELEVTRGYTSKYSGKIVIPEEVTYMNRTRKVTSIGMEAFRDCTSLTSITIPNSVTSIGSSAFRRCSGLTSIEIPNSVTSIGESAFYDCTGLTSVTIGNSVTSIGNYAFYSCSGLQKVIVSDIAAWCGIKFANVDANPLYYVKHLYSDENTEIKDLVIPNSVTSIGGYAFYYCTGLTSITIGNSVTSIGNYAFYECTGLTSVTIGNSVTSIGAYAFRGCSGLTSITIGKSVTSIGYAAFSGCSSLTSINIPDGVTSIGEDAFRYCSGLTSITIPNSVTSIGFRAFDGADIPNVISLIKNPFAIEGKTSGNRSFTLNTFNNATLYVPKGAIDKYKAMKGWKDFLFIEEGTGPNGGGETPETKKCATPTISVHDGKLSFTCETEGVTFCYSVTPPSSFQGEGNDVTLSNKYTVSVYAKKEGYENSETVIKEIEINGQNGSQDVNGDGIVDTQDVLEIYKYIQEH